MKSISMELFKVEASIDVFEYKDVFWIMEKSSQLWPETGFQNERVALAGSLPVNCNLADLGEICLNALSNYNSKKPQYEAWELPELNRLWASWVKARGWYSFLRDSRSIRVVYDVKKILLVVPMDNYSISARQPVMDAISERIIELTDDITPELLGKYVLQAMSHATWNPNKKTAKQKK